MVTRLKAAGQVRGEVEDAIEGYVTVVAGRRLPPVNFLASIDVNLLLERNQCTWLTLNLNLKTCPGWTRACSASNGATGTTVSIRFAIFDFTVLARPASTNGQACVG